MIYLDNAATTPVDPRVIDVMTDCLKNCFGNAASRSHVFGWQAEERIEEARAYVAALIGAQIRDVIFTSGATESINLALKGAAHFYKDKGRHLVTCKTEHKAVLDTMRQLEREGFEVTYLSPKTDGMIDLAELEAALRPDTILVSILHANNEIGVIQPIEIIGQMTRSRGILFHVDAAQSAGKCPIDVVAMNIDLLSMTAHKMYGPKGIGALFVSRRPRVRLEALIHGGGHERGFRSGTLANHQIVGFGEAARLCALEMKSEAERLLTLRNRLWNGLSDMDEVYLNGSMEHRLPGNLNVSFNFVEGESLIMGLKTLAVSSGSACTSASLEPSYVLRAIGRSDELAHSSIRFGLGRFTTDADIDAAIVVIKEAVTKLREMSPLWEMHLEGIDVASVQWAAH